MDWVAHVWRALCVFAALVALAAVTGVLWLLPVAVIVMLLMPSVLITITFAVSFWADLTDATTSTQAGH